ncbi:MAG: TonB-dependent receptor [Porphyromonadaceae bacterium]|nr:TonB-dependent receptor [Porphyromonadaceae bacterium]
MCRDIFRKIILSSCLLVFLSANLLAQKGGSIVLKVVEQENHNPVEAAYIIISPTSALVTDKKGQVTLPKNLNSQSSILVRYVGYREQRVPVSRLLKSRGGYTVCLVPEQSSLDEVLVKAERRSTSVNAVASKIGSDEINRSIGKSLAALLEGVSGVSSIQTGANTAKPVIHGMHGNRILIVNNGVRQAGQQWGEGHAPEVDMTSNGAIHVIKGAESVRYGSEAMGGTIVLEQKALPYRRGALSGVSNSLVGSNGRRFMQTLRLEGALPFYKDIAWRVHGTYGTSGDRSSANYLLNNTGSLERNFAIGLGFDRGRLRIEPFYSRYDEYSANPRFAQLGNEELLRERIALGRPPEETITPFSREIDYPRERVVHHLLSNKTTLNTSWGVFFHQISVQEDARKEYRIRRNNNSHIPEVDLSLLSLQNRLRWELSYRHWQSEIGAQHVLTDNYSIPGNGVVPLIPNYLEGSWGVYAMQKYITRKWSAEVGVRLDHQDTKAAGYDAYGEYYGGHRKFTNWTYSLGGRYLFVEGLSLTSNLGAAWRAPHVHELYSNGVSHGSGAYVQGDPNLASEQSYKWVNALEYKNTWLNLQLDLYLQWVNNFIYDQPLIDESGRARVKAVVSGFYPIFKYRQTDAFFRGADLSINIKPMADWSYGLITALIWANEVPSQAYLPFIPPMRIDHHLEWTPKLGKELSASLKLGHRFVAKQSRFDPKKDLIETSPEAYNLFSVDMGLTWQINQRHSLECTLSGDNIFNKEYKEYTNRARYYAHDLGRDIRFSLSWRF